jgi:ubiquinone/menaquinone biosynthesis C-methylase UbiE
MDAITQRLVTPLLGTSLVLWSRLFFEPYRESRDGRFHKPFSLGKRPPAKRLPGGGPALSLKHKSPVYLDDTPDNYDTVEQFDYWSESYDFIRPFVQPVLEETSRLMAPYLGPKARVLDPSCGPGDNAIAIAQTLPGGEVVAADLSRGMVERAFSSARALGRVNMAFFQADAADPPVLFDGYFDLVLCCLAFHHYTDPERTAAAFRRVLAPGGVLVIADGDPSWNEPLVTIFSKLADPGFVRHRRGQEFLTLLQKAGFSTVSWTRVLPGIGVTIAAA